VETEHLFLDASMSVPLNSICSLQASRRPYFLGAVTRHIKVYLVGWSRRSICTCTYLCNDRNA